MMQKEISEILTDAERVHKKEGFPSVYVVEQRNREIMYYKRMSERSEEYQFSIEEAKIRLEIYEELKYVDFYHPETRFGIYGCGDRGRYSIESLMPSLDIDPSKSHSKREYLLEKVDICRQVLKEWDKRLYTDVGIFNWGFDGDEPYFIDMEIISDSNFMSEESISYIVKDHLSP